MTKFLSLRLLAALAVLGLSGIVHGMWTNRWNAGMSVEGINLLENLDRDIGGWRPSEFLSIDPAELPAKTRCDSRRFEPVKGAKPVVISITSGNPGAVAVHTPDVCFLGAGWKLRGAVTRETVTLVDNTAASFWVADFVKTHATGSDAIRVRWAWTANGTWQAPDYPRWIFARAPLLYKFYLVHPLGEDVDLRQSDPYQDFITRLMPVLSRQVHTP